MTEQTTDKDNCEYCEHGIEDVCNCEQTTQDVTKRRGAGLMAQMVKVEFVWEWQGEDNGGWNLYEG